MKYCKTYSKKEFNRLCKGFTKDDIEDAFQESILCAGAQCAERMFEDSIKDKETRKKFIEFSKFGSFVAEMLYTRIRRYSESPGTDHLSLRDLENYREIKKVKTSQLKSFTECQDIINGIRIGISDIEKFIEGKGGEK